MMRSTIRLGLFLSLLVCAPRAALAADPPSSADAKKEEARSHFEKGIALFEEEAWDAALAEFMRSREVFPTRSATKDAALCLRKLHRFDEALDIFEALLRDFPSLPPDDRDLADRQIRDLATLVGRIEIRGAEPGATIVVDGRERGAAPVPPIRVNAGTHLVRVSREGFAPLETQSQVAGGQTVLVQAKLAALTQGGRLRVVEQSGRVAELVVDNVAVGKTPWEGTLPVGDHTVILLGAGKLGTQPAAAPVRLNQMTSLTLAIEDVDATLRVEPTPAGASVALDGVAIGRGVWEGRVRAGGHRVEVASEGFLPLIREIAIDHEKRESVTAQLERDPNSAMWRAANPSRFFLGVEGAALLTPSLGGDVAAACSGSCERTIATGLMVVGHGGYQLGSGLGFSIDGGFLTATQHVRNRPVSPTPRGLEPADGIETDDIRLSGMLLGASAGFARGESVPLLLRLGAGALLGSVRDRKRGDAITKERGPVGMRVAPLPFSFDTTETPSARYLYFAPEVGIGLRLGKHVELAAKAQVLIMVALSDAKWSDQHPPVPDPRVGEVTFGNQAVAGRTIVMVAPGIGARYIF